VSDLCQKVTHGNKKLLVNQLFTRSLSAREEITSASSGGSGDQKGSVPKTFIPLRGIGHFYLSALANEFARYQTKTPP
jgi:hypothetical protein